MAPPITMSDISDHVTTGMMPRSDVEAGGHEEEKQLSWPEEQDAGTQDLVESSLDASSMYVSSESTHTSACACAWTWAPCSASSCHLNVQSWQFASKLQGGQLQTAVDLTARARDLKRSEAI